MSILFCLFFSPPTIAGFVEIAQLLLNTANDPECIKRMLESVDAEGDTVSIYQT